MIVSIKRYNAACEKIRNLTSESSRQAMDNANLVLQRVKERDQIKSLIAEYEMKLENAERYGHGDPAIYDELIKKLKELVG